MMCSNRPGQRILAAGLSAAMLLPAGAACADSPQPIPIAVIAAQSTINGKGIIQGAQLAAQKINAAGGINGRPIKLITMDNHSSASDGVRAFQRAVKQDHAVAVVGTFISEVALAQEPWAARLKEPFIITGAWSTKVNERIHNNYARYKYVFRTTFNSNTGARVVCGYAKDILSKKLGYKRAAVVSEDFAWTKPLDKEYMKCLPKAGLKMVDHVRFSGDTSNFSPIFNRIEKHNAGVMITGMAHAGTRPTVQWHSGQNPFLFAGWSSQAGSSSFWKDTNGATEGVITGTVASDKAAITPKTIPFANKFEKAFGTSPSYTSYSTYDTLFILKNAIERAGTTNADALVKSLEKTDYVGTQGREQFLGRDAKFVHGLRFGKKYVSGIAIQWQHGNPVVIWPASVADGKVELPKFVPEPAGSGS
ncbi:ABC transporter substrate-binding protein [Salinisphaera sp. RV14]|uniref:ABC transporter substrate-binding protein n=1 Tax=Salinisphaera sp. RV14 TaxID=3454140 RepID=UPI003F867B3F